MSGASERGFTLVEVMLALAILVGGLVILLRGTAQNIQTSQRSEMIGIATDLARGKMYDIEEKLLKDGFGELDIEDEGDFDEEGWPEYKWSYKVEKVELPNAGALGALQGEEGEEGSDSAGDPLGGLLGMGGGDASALGGASFITGQFEMISQILEASIRKVTLTLEWKALVSDEELVVVCFFTNPAAMSQVLGGLPSAGTSSDGDDSGSGTTTTGGGRNTGGSGTGSSSGGSTKR